MDSNRSPSAIFCPLNITISHHKLVLGGSGGDMLVTTFLEQLAQDLEHMTTKFG
jgi:hypothetical protein